MQARTDDSLLGVDDVPRVVVEWNVFVKTPFKSATLIIFLRLAKCR